MDIIDSGGTSSYSDLDAWIEKLYACKPLTENEIKILCEKACIQYIIHFIISIISNFYSNFFNIFLKNSQKKYLWKNQMFNLLDVL